MLQIQVEKKLAGVTQANRTDSEVALECNMVLSFWSPISKENHFKNLSIYVQSNNLPF